MSDILEKILTVKREEIAAAKRIKPLAAVRAEAEALFREVAATNEASPPPEGSTRVTFYVGQNVLPSDLRNEE